MLKNIVRTLLIITVFTFTISTVVVLLTPYWHKTKFGREYNPAGCNYLRYPDNIVLKDTYDLQIMSSRARDLGLKSTYTTISTGTQMNLEFAGLGGTLHYVAIRQYRDPLQAVISSYRIDRGCDLKSVELYSQTIGTLDTLGLETDWVSREPLTEFSAQ